MMRMYMGVLGEETPHVVVGSMRLAGFWITNVINMDGRRLAVRGSHTRRVLASKSESMGMWFMRI